MFVRNVVLLTAMLLPTLAYSEPGPLRSAACMSDIKAICGSVQPGGGRIRECIKAHRAELSSGCKVPIADRMLERQANQSAGTPAAASSVLTAPKAQ